MSANTIFEFPNLSIHHDVVNQTTNATTAVTLNKSCGAIITQSLSTGEDATTSFTLNNSFINSDSTVLVSLNNYSGTYGTNGIPVVSVSSIQNGSCVINISNVHSSNDLDGTVEVAFLVC